MNITSFFKLSGEPFPYNPHFHKEFGISVKATIFLCFIGWKAFDGQSNAWRDYTAEQIEERTGLTWEEQKCARHQLTEKGLIEERHARLEHKLYFRLPEPANQEKPDSESDSSGFPNQEKPDSTIKGKNSIKNNLNTKGTKEFDEFWKAYPRHEKKSYAMACFKKALGKTTLEAILKAIEQQKQTTSCLTSDRQFIPHPSSWLNGERWLDELTNSQPSGPPPAQPSGPQPKKPWRSIQEDGYMV